MQNNDLYKHEFDLLIDELKENKMFLEYPRHTQFIHKPIVGDNYFNAAQKVFFIGQDTNHAGDDIYNDTLIARVEYIKTQHWAGAFDFNSNDNFLLWLKYNYWKFPLRFMNLLMNQKNAELSPNEIKANQEYEKIFKSFGWANLGPIVFSNIYEKQKIESKISLTEYAKLFKIVQKHFGTYKLLEKYYQPDIIIILTDFFKYVKADFFKGVDYIEKSIDEQNKITKYTVENNGRKTNIFTTYHPSAMLRLRNRYKGNRLTLEQFVEVIYKNIDTEIMQ